MCNEFIAHRSLTCAQYSKMHHMHIFTHTSIFPKTCSPPKCFWLKAVHNASVSVIKSLPFVTVIGFSWRFIAARADGILRPYTATKLCIIPSTPNNGNKEVACWQAIRQDRVVLLCCGVLFTFWRHCLRALSLTFLRYEINLNNLES